NSGVPGATTSRAIASASATRQPSSARTPSTNDLPTAIDPVKPTFSIYSAGSAGILPAQPGTGKEACAPGASCATTFSATLPLAECFALASPPLIIRHRLARACAVPRPDQLPPGERHPPTCNLVARSLQSSCRPRYRTTRGPPLRQ